MTEKNIVLSFEERLSKVKMPSGKRNTLLAAMKLFAAQGFHGTSTAQIAEVAGVSQATIFKYLKFKFSSIPLRNGINVVVSVG